MSVNSIFESLLVADCSKWKTSYDITEMGGGCLLPRLLYLKYYWKKIKMLHFT